MLVFSPCVLGQTVIKLVCLSVLGFTATLVTKDTGQVLVIVKDLSSSYLMYVNVCIKNKTVKI